MDQISKLKTGLDLSITKDYAERRSSLAVTANGREYLGALIGSDTHLMHIPSEQVALALSIASLDFPITEIITLTEKESPIFSPIALKIMIDYAIRTQVPLKYTLRTEKELLYQVDDVRSVLSFYNPGSITISKIKEQYAPSRERANASELKKYALKGLDRNFPLYDRASSYGSAVYTKSGNIYYAGQYSSPDKRLNLHSEMVAIISAIMNGGKDITHIGIVSNKYPDSPCNMCGVCRQFISEISAKLGISPKLYCFAQNTNEFKEWSIKDYLPDSWSSKKW